MLGDFNMQCSIKGKQLANHVHKQICLFYPDGFNIEISNIEKCINSALDRVEYCFRNNRNKYYCNENNETLFNHLNADHYATFLYFLSNTIWLEFKDEMLSAKIFLLNKALHGIDLFYEISMPDIFMLVHPLGTVLGRASYSNYLVVYQGCTVGSVSGSGFPSIDEHLTMYSNSSLLGDCKVGSNVTIGANSYAINTLIEKNQIVVGQYPHLKMTQSKPTKSIFFH
tara:strand:- start:3137 stop:3814 length:678 start_codon:yes stop_codon:yes gene_type:complete